MASRQQIQKLSARIDALHRSLKPTTPLVVFVQHGMSDAEMQARLEQRYLEDPAALAHELVVYITRFSDQGREHGHPSTA